MEVHACAGFYFRKEIACCLKRDILRLFPLLAKRGCSKTACPYAYRVSRAGRLKAFLSSGKFHPLQCFGNFLLLPLCHMLWKHGGNYRVMGGFVLFMCK